MFAVSFCENYESLLNPTLFYRFGWYLDYTKDMIEFDKHSEGTIDTTQMASLENTNLVIDEDQNTRA